MALDTLRVLFVMRGRKGPAWLTGFFQSAIFILAISAVLSGLDNPIKVFGYAAGFATGNVIGIWLEERLAIGYNHVSVISSGKGAALAHAMRSEGYAVTEIPARGKDGTVTLLNCHVKRKNLNPLNALIQQVDNTAFITAEEVRPIRRGFWRA